MRTSRLLCLAFVLVLGVLLLRSEAPAQEPHGAWQPERGLLIRGTVVTMNDRREVIENGAVYVRDGLIQAVIRAGEALPAGADQATVVDSRGGLIFPGLIDCHNHLEYDFRPMWNVPRRYNNMYEWMGSPEYERNIKYPKRLVSSLADMGAEIGIYSEVKMLVGGTTSVQGSPPDRAYTNHLVRNVEHGNFGRDRIFQRSMGIMDTRWREGLEAGLLAKVRRGSVDCWLVHLAEGTDEAAHQEFVDLQRLGLLGPFTAIIHGIALRPPDFEAMARAGATLVASPLDNYLLYGQTANISAAVRAGVNVCIGSDWSPYGSKNLLSELKIVDQLNRTQWNRLLDARQIVEMVTVNPARTLHWQDVVGSIQPGLHADLLVMDRIAVNPYRSLIDSTEMEVQLVTVDGEPLYGDLWHMEPLKGDDLEVIFNRGGRRKAIDITPDPEVAERAGIENPDRRLSEISNDLTRALSLDERWLRRHIPAASGMTRTEFRTYFRGRFPGGIDPIPLDPVFAFGDTSYFGAIRNSANAHFPFDIETYWTRADARAARRLAVADPDGNGIIDRLSDLPTR